MAERLPRYRQVGLVPTSIGSLPSVDVLSSGLQVARGYERMSAALDKLSSFAFEKASERQKLQIIESAQREPENFLQQLSGKSLADMSANERTGYTIASKRFGAELEVEARRQIGEIILRGKQKGLNTTEIITRVDEAVAGYSSAGGNLSPDIAASLKNNLNNLRNAQFLNLSERDMRLEEAKFRAEGIQGVSEISRNVEDMARAGMSNFDDVLANELEGLEAYMEHHQFSPDQIAKTLIGVRQDANIARLRGGFDKSQSIRDKRSYIDTLKESIENGNEQAAGLSNDQLSTVVSQFETSLAKDIRELKPKYDAISDFADKNFFDVIGGGNKPVDGVGQEIQRQLNELSADGYDTSGLQAKINNAQKMQSRMETLRPTSVVEKEQMIAGLNSINLERGLTGEQAILKESLEKQVKLQKTALKSDPINYGRTTQQITGGNLMVEANGKSVAEVQALVDKRIVEATSFAQRQGLVDIPLLDQSETETIIKSFKNGNDKQRAEFLGSLAASWGNNARSIFQSVSKDDALLAHIGGLVARGSSPRTVEAALRGYRLLEEDAATKGAMSSVEFRSATGKYFASMASTPKLQAQLREATNAIYLGKGGQPGEYDKDKFEDALQEEAGRTKDMTGRELGGIVKYKNKALVLPTSIPQKDFEDLVEEAPVQAFFDFRTGEVPLDLNGKPLDVDLLRDQGNIRLVQSAGGRARLFFVVNGSEFEATNSAGGSIEINLNNFSPEFAESLQDVDPLERFAPPTPREKFKTGDSLIEAQPYNGWFRRLLNQTDQSIQPDMTEEYPDQSIQPDMTEEYPDQSIQPNMTEEYPDQSIQPDMTEEYPDQNITPSTAIKGKLSTQEMQQVQTANAKGRPVVDLAVRAVDALFGGGSFLTRIAKVESDFGDNPETFKRISKGIWQIDPIGFKETRRNTNKLRKARDKIKSEFGIDYMQLKHVDLQKPLYGALAARLFLLSRARGPLPTTLEGQAKLWKRIYNTAKGRGTVEQFINKNSGNQRSE